MRLLRPFAFTGALAWLVTASPSAQPRAEIWLEIPEVEARIPGNGSAVIPAGDISHFRIRIAKSPQLVNFSTLFSKINTESANMVMTTTNTADGIICQFDLSLRAGFKFRRGRNSVEVSFKDRWQRLHYASFLIQTSGSQAFQQQTVSLTPETHTGERYAVVVGISRYKFSSSGVPNLRYADRDASQFRDFLVSPGGGGFRPENIRLLLNEDATTRNIRSALFTFLTQPGPDDLVVIYFAGHGGADPNDPRNLYLLTHDTDPRDMGGTGFPMWEFQGVYMRILKAKRVVTFADSCHSYGISGEASEPQQNNLINQYLASYATQASRAAITASDISELSYESEDWGGGHGVFTHFLLEGLGGQADFNEDGTVTAGELFPYLRTKVRSATEGRQNPTAFPGLAESLPLSGFALRAGLQTTRPQIHE